jgi:hypothetical protein
VKSKSQYKRRRKLQQGIRQYAIARENLQLAGVLDTLPVGAIRSERDNPGSQAETPSIRLWRSLIMQAKAEGWATSEEGKRKVVGRLVEIIESDESEGYVKIAAARTLQQLDRDEWERRNPELAGKVKGGVQVNNTQQVAVTGDMAIALLQKIEAETGRKVMSAAMLEVERVADEVLPPEVL